MKVIGKTKASTFSPSTLSDLYAQFGFTVKDARVLKEGKNSLPVHDELGELLIVDGMAIEYNVTDDKKEGVS